MFSMLFLHEYGVWVSDCDIFSRFLIGRLASKAFHIDRLWTKRPLREFVSISGRVLKPYVSCQLIQVSLAADRPLGVGFNGVSI